MHWRRSRARHPEFAIHHSRLVAILTMGTGGSAGAITACSIPGRPGLHRCPSVQRVSAASARAGRPARSRREQPGTRGGGRRRHLDNAVTLSPIDYLRPDADRISSNNTVGGSVCSGCAVRQCIVFNSALIAASGRGRRRAAVHPASAAELGNPQGSAPIARGADRRKTGARSRVCTVAEGPVVRLESDAARDDDFGGRMPASPNPQSPPSNEITLPVVLVVTPVRAWRPRVGARRPARHLPHRHAPFG
jgi:hypothetical protein